MVQPKPPKSHAKAFGACFVLIGISLAFSWAVPFIHVTCTRNAEQVECVVQQRLLGLIPFDTTTIRDLKTASLQVDQGTRSSTRIKTTDTAHLILANAQGEEKKVLLESGEEFDMTRSQTFADGIESFLDSSDSRFSNWTVPLIGYGPFVPAVLGLLLLSLVLCDFVGTKFGTAQPKTE